MCPIFQAGHDNVFVSPPKLFILATTPNTIEIYATFDPPIREALLIFWVDHSKQKNPG